MARERSGTHPACAAPGSALIWAQFRAGALSRPVPALLPAAVLADATMPGGDPEVVKPAGMALFPAWSVAPAVAVRRLSPR